jgi:hypothetical protein
MDPVWWYKIGAWRGNTWRRAWRLEKTQKRMENNGEYSVELARDGWGLGKRGGEIQAQASERVEPKLTI